MAIEDEDREMARSGLYAPPRFPDGPGADGRELRLGERGRYQAAHVRDFVPVLVENAVMDVLRSGERAHRPPRGSVRPDR